MWRSLFEDAIRPAIAFFYATGVAVDGITGPFLFGKMIESSEESQVAIAFFLGAAVMAVGGIVGLLSGVKAVQQSLEDIAEPLTEQDAEGAGDRDHDEAAAAPSAQRPGSELAARGGRGRTRAATSLPPRAGADHRLLAEPTERRELARFRPGT